MKVLGHDNVSQPTRPVVQPIGLQFPKLTMQVRFLPGLPFPKPCLVLRSAYSFFQSDSLMSEWKAPLEKRPARKILCTSHSVRLEYRLPHRVRRSPEGRLRSDRWWVGVLGGIY